MYRIDYATSFVFMHISFEELKGASGLCTTRAKVIICYVYAYKYGTNRTSECYSIPALYYAELFLLISKYFNSKCPVVNTSAVIFIPTKMATETRISRWNVLKSLVLLVPYV